MVVGNLSNFWSTLALSPMLGKESKELSSESIITGSGCVVGPWEVEDGPHNSDGSSFSKDWIKGSNWGSNNFEALVDFFPFELSEPSDFFFLFSGLSKGKKS